MWGKFIYYISCRVREKGKKVEKVIRTYSDLKDTYKVYPVLFWVLFAINGCMLLALGYVFGEVESGVVHTLLSVAIVFQMFGVMSFISIPYLEHER